MDKGARSSHFAQFLLTSDLHDRHANETKAINMDWFLQADANQLISRFCKRRDLDRQANLCAGKGPTKANLEKISSRLVNGRDVLARRPHFQSNKSKHPPPYSTLAKTYSQWQQTTTWRWVLQQNNFWDRRQPRAIVCSKQAWKWSQPAEIALFSTMRQCFYCDKIGLDGVNCGHRLVPLYCSNVVPSKKNSWLCRGLRWHAQQWRSHCEGKLRSIHTEST